MMRKIDEKERKCCNKEICEFQDAHKKVKGVLNRIIDEPPFKEKLFSTVPYLNYGPFVVLLSQATTFTEEEIASVLKPEGWTVLNHTTGMFAVHPVRMERINFLGCIYDTNETQFTTGPHLCDGITKQKTKKDKADVIFEEMLIYPFKSLSATKEIIRKHERIWKSHLSDEDLMCLHKKMLIDVFNLRHTPIGVTKYMNLEYFNRCELLTCEMRVNRATGNLTLSDRLGYCRCGYCDLIGPRSRRFRDASVDYCCQEMLDNRQEDSRAFRERMLRRINGTRCLAKSFFDEYGSSLQRCSAKKIYEKINTEFLRDSGVGYKTTNEKHLPTCFIMQTALFLEHCQRELGLSPRIVRETGKYLTFRKART
uniref:DNA-directed DNA polymerase n=1 Tax=Steinernema glaseri TaxID=37863 RepID=A0A1I7YXJ4_9BILA